MPTKIAKKKPARKLSIIKTRPARTAARKSTATKAKAPAKRSILAKRPAARKRSAPARATTTRRASTKKRGLLSRIRARGFTKSILVFAMFAVIGGGVLIWTRAATATYTLWSGSAVPKTITDSDSSSVELGVKFKAQNAGYVNGIRFYKGPQNTGTHTGSLWDSAGHLLGSLTFSKETATGWQQASFTKPISVAANTTYIVSYHAPKGHYSGDNNYFNAAHVSGPLTAPKSSSANPNGVYKYGTSSAFPNSTYRASNYWVDVVYSTSLISPTPAPAAPTGVTATQNSKTVIVAWQASVSATPISNYNIVRGGSKVGSVTGTVLTYTDSTVSAGNTYSYQVQAVDNTGAISANSASVSITLPGTTPPPPVTCPSGTTGTPPNCVTPPPTCPSGQTGTPPNCVTPPPPPVTSSCSPYSSNSTAASCGFPTADNTGPAAGTAFTSQSNTGTCLTITAANTVINAVKMNGCIDVEASNVTIQNSHITSNNWWGIKYGYTSSSATGLKILHTTVDSTPGKGPDSGGYDYGIIQNNTGTMEVGFSNISGFKNGIDSVNSNIHDNYVHDLSYFSGAHTQDIYVWPGPAIITHNTLINQVPLSNSTAAIYIAPDSSNQHDVSVNNNWMAGGAYTFYGGDTNAKNIKVTNNAFSNEIFANSGSYGPDASTYWHANNAGNVWSGNVWGNGSQAGQTINP